MLLFDILRKIASVKKILYHFKLCFVWRLFVGSANAGVSLALSFRDGYGQLENGGIDRLFAC